MHDIGKIGMPNSILKKQGRLNPKEIKVMHLHPQLGFELLSSLDCFKLEKHIVLQHHERVDGKGYPRGLPEEKLCFLTKILTICDSYDAMTADRCYKSGKRK